MHKMDGASESHSPLPPSKGPPVRLGPERWAGAGCAYYEGADTKVPRSCIDGSFISGQDHKGWGSSGTRCTSGTGGRLGCVDARGMAEPCLDVQGGPGRG